MTRNEERWAGTGDWEPDGPVTHDCGHAQRNHRHVLDESGAAVRTYCPACRSDCAERRTDAYGVPYWLDLTTGFEIRAISARRPRSKRR